MKLSVLFALLALPAIAHADNAPEGMPKQLACSKTIETGQKPDPNCHPHPHMPAPCPTPTEDYGWAAMPIQYVQDGDVLRGVAEIDDNFFSVYKVNFTLEQDRSKDSAPTTQKIDITVKVGDQTFSGPNPLTFPSAIGKAWIRCKAL
jgi:hypothetical protein